MPPSKYGQLSCGWPLCGDFNTAINDAVLGMRLPMVRSGLYGRYLRGTHAYGEKHTVDEFMRWLNTERHIRYGDLTVMGYPVSLAVPSSIAVRLYGADDGIRWS